MPHMTHAENVWGGGGVARTPRKEALYRSYNLFSPNFLNLHRLSTPRAGAALVTCTVIV